MKWWLIAVLSAACLVLLVVKSPAKDDGRYAQNPLKGWFDSLHSQRGMCCSFADGRTVEDPDIDMAGNHYRVRIDGVWYDVPDSALIDVPNKFGRPVVWPYTDQNGVVQIRCFIAGAGI